MTTQRVDTSRPEYSWIPFFEELARRLHEDGWRHKQPEIVAELQRMRREGMDIVSSVDDLTDEIDPFSLYAQIRRVGFKKAKMVMGAYHEFFKLDVGIKLPLQDPINPSRLPNNSMFYQVHPSVSPVGPHWDLFEYVMSSDRSVDGPGNTELVSLIDASIGVNGAGMAGVTGALHWILPHRFLKTDTIDHFLGEFNYKDSGRNYLERLAELCRAHDRPLPELNCEHWLISQFRSKSKNRNMWQVRGGKGFSAWDRFLKGGFTGIAFGVDSLDLSEYRDSNLSNDEITRLNPKIGKGAIGQIETFARNIRSGDIVVMPTATNGAVTRYGFVMSDVVWHVGHDFGNRFGVLWRPSALDGEGLGLPGASTVQEVAKARDALMDQIKIAEGIPASDDPMVDLPDGECRVWLVRANGGSNATTVVNSGYTGIGWDDLNLDGVRRRDVITEMHRKAYLDASAYRRGQEVGSIFRFLNGMSVGDYVVTPDAEGRFYYGTVTSDPKSGEDGGPYRTRRSVDWNIHDSRRKSDLPESFWKRNQTVMEVDGDDRTAFLDLIQTAPVRVTYTFADALNEGVFLESEDLQRIDAVWRGEKNLILQGPPGVGKTFVTRRLAYVLMGERADERIASVQFHQSYSYEDFVGGYRPSLNDDGQLVFEARDGAFLRLCEVARDDPNNRYVMAIDEINRGNLSRVFGELLMLIEGDKRSERHAVELQHRLDMVRAGRASVASFFVPDNVYIIGTMNLADRSLTGMNVAMRRRFGFAELVPQFGRQRFRAWLKESRFADDEHMPNGMQDRIHRRLTALNDTIAKETSLGNQYAVGHSFFCPKPDRDPPDGEWEEWYETVVMYKIRPLLLEYWFDEPDKAEREVKRLLGREDADDLTASENAVPESEPSDA